MATRGMTSAMFKCESRCMYNHQHWANIEIRHQYHAVLYSMFTETCHYEVSAIACKLEVKNIVLEINIRKISFEKHLSYKRLKMDIAVVSKIFTGKKHYKNIE